MYHPVQEPHWLLPPLSPCREGLLLTQAPLSPSGFAFANVVDKHPSVLTRYDGTKYAAAWEGMWRFLAYQFEHVAWTGCSFWDLIQPSFMFIVGVAMPFSYAKRQVAGEPWLRSFGHVLVRSLVLILLLLIVSSSSALMVMLPPLPFRASVAMVP